MTKTIAVSVNSSWNLLNFRADLLRRLIGHGFNVVALTPDDDHVANLAALGIDHVSVPIDSKGVSPAHDAWLILRYWSALRRIQPAVFLGWTIKPNVYGSLAAHALGIPTVNNISGLGTAFIRTGPLTYLVRLLYRAALARSATVFFQNRHDRDLFVAQQLVRRERSVLLPGSGIDLTKFVPAVGEGGPFVFLLVARLLRDKGVAEFADAARMIRAARPGAAIFRLLGSLDAQNRTAFPRETVENWVAEGVLEYLGEAVDVRPFLAKAGAVVLPSYREGMPRSLLEAAAMGKPLIATDVPGCTEIARSGENAILCPPRNAEALANAMLAMLDLSRSDRLIMGQRSRTIAQEEFDTNIVEERYLAAIEQVIASSAQPIAGVSDTQ